MRRITISIIVRTFMIIATAIIIVYIIRQDIRNNNANDNLEHYYQKDSKSINKKDWVYSKDRLKFEDRLKFGLDAHGKPAYLPFTQNDYNAKLSDMISLTRPVPDIRNPACDAINYYNIELPSVSVIISIFNEHWSILLRSINSVLNKSPSKLIYEIILVDDGSKTTSLTKKLINYIAKNLPKVHIVRYKIRRGHVAAQLAGASIAKGEVLLFLDSRIEPNYNWLPPLLKPIAYNSKIVVCPLIDTIKSDTFQYIAECKKARGGFDWEFGYNRLPLLPDDLKDPTKPYRSPVMKAGIFAINRKWFWELGGYDPELDICGGEQYELSFKIWMCGGELLEAPCSRVAHLYQNDIIFSRNNFGHRNYKRVAEVWMDEYAKFVYGRQRTLYDAIDAGDLSHRKAIRKQLNCKSFKWYMENIAFDIFDYYPPVEQPSYAYGSIQSMAEKNLCLDTFSHEDGEEPGLYTCISPDPKTGLSNQNWEISWQKDLRLRSIPTCIELANLQQYGKLAMYPCHKQQGNQSWFYDYKKNLLKQGRTGFCMEANITARTVYVNECNDSNINMKWKFDFYNATGLKYF